MHISKNYFNIINDTLLKAFIINRRTTILFFLNKITNFISVSFKFYITSLIILPML